MAPLKLDLSLKSITQRSVEKSMIAGGIPFGDVFDRSKLSLHGEISGTWTMDQDFQVYLRN